MQSLSVINAAESSVSDNSTHQITGETPGRGTFLPDWLGIVASVGCAIHCAAMPFVIAFLPMLGLSFLADEAFHKVMVVVCTLLALLAFVPGWRKHRRWLPAGIALAGLGLIGTAAFALEDSCACCTLPESTSSESATTIEPVVASSTCTDKNCEHCAKAAAAAGNAPQETLETAEPMMAGFVPWITPLGGILLISAHLVNRRYACLCGCCPTDSATA